MQTAKLVVSLCARLAVFQQFVGLVGGRDVASEENDAGRLEPGEKRPKPGRHLGAVKADDEELTSIKFLVHSPWWLIVCLSCGARPQLRSAKLLFNRFASLIPLADSVPPAV